MRWWNLRCGITCEDNVCIMIIKGRNPSLKVMRFPLVLNSLFTRIHSNNWDTTFGVTHCNVRIPGRKYFVYISEGLSIVWDEIKMIHSNPKHHPAPSIPPLWEVLLFTCKGGWGKLTCQSSPRILSELKNSASCWRCSDMAKYYCYFLLSTTN